MIRFIKNIGNNILISDRQNYGQISMATKRVGTVNSTTSQSHKASSFRLKNNRSTCWGTTSTLIRLKCQNQKEIKRVCAP